MKGRLRLYGPKKAQWLSKGVISEKIDVGIIMGALMNQPLEFENLLQQAEALYGKDNVWKLLLEPSIDVEYHSNRNSGEILSEYGISALQFAAWSGDFYHYISEDGLTDGVNPKYQAIGSDFFLNKMFDYIPEAKRQMALMQLDVLRNHCKFVPLLDLMEGYANLADKLAKASNDEYAATALNNIAKIQQKMPRHIIAYMNGLSKSDSLPDFNNRFAPDRDGSDKFRRTPKTVAEAIMYFNYAKKLLDTKVEMFEAFFAYQQMLEDKYRGRSYVGRGNKRSS